MAEMLVKALPFIVVGIFSCYWGYDWGADTVAQQYAGSAHDLLEIFLRGNK